MPTFVRTLVRELCAAETVHDAAQIDGTHVEVTMKGGLRYYLTIEEV